MVGCDFIVDGIIEVVEVCEGDLFFDGVGLLVMVCGIEIGYIF